MVRTTVGTDGANLSHILTVNNLVKFRIIEKYSADVFTRGDMVICPRPIFESGCNLSHFGLFELGSTLFLQSFFGLWVKIENMSFFNRM